MPKQAKRSSRNQKKNRSRGPSQYLSWGIGLAVVLFAAIAFWVSRGSEIPFEITGGETNPLILLRDETTVYYEFKFTGSAPVVLERIIPQIQVYSDQVLVADVMGGSVITDNGEIQLEQGYIPEEIDFTLQPDETFRIGITYLGRELGWNKIYGFRLQYSQEGSSIDAVLELTDNYYIFVE